MPRINLCSVRSGSRAVGREISIGRGLLSVTAARSRSPPCRQSRLPHREQAVLARLRPSVVVGACKACPAQRRMRSEDGADGADAAQLREAREARAAVGEPPDLHAAVTSQPTTHQVLVSAIRCSCDNSEFFYMFLFCRYSVSEFLRSLPLRWQWCWINRSWRERLQPFE